MAIQKEKTISYRRTVWFDGAGTTLERCIRDAHAQLKSIDERTVGDGGRLMRSAKQKENSPSGGVLLHLTAENPGASTSVVPHVPKTARSLDLKTEQPPSYGEWLDGDAFMLIKDDHICICTTDIRDRAIEYFFKELFRKAKIRQDSTRFQFQKNSRHKQNKALTLARSSRSRDIRCTL